MRYVEWLLAFFFGCHHSNLSRVFTISSRTYCVCCDCGVEFDYSLETMSIKAQDIPYVGIFRPDLLKKILPET